MALPISPATLPRFKISAFQLLLFLSLSIFETASAQTNLITPWDYLKSQPKPNFAPGNHLPRLTKWMDGNLSSNTTVEIAYEWGYTLDLGPISSSPAVLGQPETFVTSLNKSGTVLNYLISLATNDPAHYQLSVDINRTFPSPVPNDFYVTNSNGWFVDSTGTNSFQYATNTTYAKVISPEGDPTYWTNATAWWVSALQAIRSNAPISIVLNGGEYGLAVPAGSTNAWGQDPRVHAANPGPFNGLSWPTYISIKKAYELDLLSAAVRQVLPDRQLYIYYATDTEANRIYPDSPPWDYWWGYNSETISNCTDLPNYQSYYEGWPGANWTNIYSSSIGGIATYRYDLLTQYLNCVGFHLTFSEPLSYDWVCAGWSTNMATNSPIPLYMGFLKCCYTGGMVGGVAGYFSLPTNGYDAAFPSNSPPYWLSQIEALSHVHGLFTYLEPFLTNGSLLPGPYHHAMSTDQPAYEFTSRAGLGSNDRVLVRQMNKGNVWLACAWAADGINTNVTVTIPTLGPVTLLARDCGAVYLLTSTNSTMIDINGLLPTASFAGPVPPTDLHVVPITPN